MWGFAIVGVVVAMLVAAWVVTDVESRRAGCERVKQDRMANAEGWRAEETASRSLWRTGHHLSDLRAAIAYDRIATGLETRAHVNCTSEYPYWL